LCFRNAAQATRLWLALLVKVSAPALCTFGRPSTALFVFVGASLAFFAFLEASLASRYRFDQAVATQAALPQRRRSHIRRRSHNDGAPASGGAATF
jgi:hypothetical protein